MIDGYIASKIARMEHEERVRHLAPVRDYDEWLTLEAGNWQAPRTASVFAAVGRGLVSLGEWLQGKPESDVEVLPAVQEAGSLTG